MLRALLSVFAIALCTVASAVEDEPIRVDRWLVLDAPDERGRRPFNPSAVVAAHLLHADQAPPQVGDTLVGERGVECVWEAVEASEKGSVEARRGWAYARLEHDVDEVVLARAVRASRLWVNGERVTGDVYGANFGAVPIALRAGTNHLFVGGMRGRDFKLVLTRPEHDLLLPTNDDTKPDLVAGEPIDARASVLVVNASRFWARDVVVEVTGGELVEAVEVPLDDPLPPLGMTKVTIPLRGVDGAVAPAEGKVTVALRCGEATRDLALRVADPEGVVVRTFTSDVDRSLQQYAVRAPSETSAVAPALVLSLHGAGVGCRGQAKSYAPKPDLWIVAPTNRRPFGFDWQDWGRLDAYEVLDEALALTGADPDRVSLTGHSMGGHGVWHLGVNDPDRFAALAPSAGWASFDTYSSRPEGSWSFLWHGADAASSTYDLLPNLADTPIAMLHGGDDRNVPRAEADGLSAALTSLRVPHTLHVEPGKGHWWNGPRGDGVDCVDWPPFFELFAEARRVRDPERLSVRIASPSVDAQHHWVAVDQVRAAGRTASVDGAYDRAASVVSLTTDNVRRLRVETPGDWAVEALELDGQRVDVAGPAPWAVVRDDDDAWRPAAPEPPPGEKRAGCSGPFKCVFSRPFVLVVGTGGDAARDALLLARARDDAQQWWYRGNGRAPIVTDEEFLAGAFDGRWRDDHVVLYGNALTNRAWAQVLGPDRPIDVSEGALRVGDERHEGDDLAALIVRPRADGGGLVGVFAGTGPAGDRLTGVVPVFVSGVGVPDYVVFDAEVLRRGDDGVRAAGFFEHDWSLRAP